MTQSHVCLVRLSKRGNPATYLLAEGSPLHAVDTEERSIAVYERAHALVMSGEWKKATLEYLVDENGSLRRGATCVISRKPEPRRRSGGRT